MESRPTNCPLIVVMGETASGKSALAMELAKRFNGEIICADSRTVYKGMDIGTAKPSVYEQRNITHHLLDIVGPNQDFTAAQFKELANGVIADVTERGKLPILAGGTGLYIDGVLFDFGFEKKGDKKPMRLNTLVLGLEISKDELKARVHTRVEQMMAAGLVEEVKQLAERYGWQASALTGIGYREFQAYFAGLQTLPETIELIERNTILYAKRQRTWFKRNNSIHWLSDPRVAVDLVTTFLNKKR